MLPELRRWTNTGSRYILITVMISPTVVLVFTHGSSIYSVASELFPVIMDAELLSCSIGVTSGFAIALSFIYGLEYMAEYLESLPDSGGTYEAVPSQKYERAISYPEGMDQEDLIDPGKYDIVPTGVLFIDIL